MSEPRRLLKCLLFLMLTASVFVFLLGYYTSANSPTTPYPLEAYSSLVRPPEGQQNMRAVGRFISHNLTAVDFVFPDDGFKFTDVDIVRGYDFDTDDDQNVIVFLHMQKTGGSSFGRHLVRHTSLRWPCRCYVDRKRCDCENSRKHHWLFSRYSIGWACGLHADWTELHACVPDTLDAKEKESRQRRYLYLTILRDPIQRYLSEWKHVQRGSTWLSAKLMCDGRQATLQEVPFCFQGKSWTGVTLDDFMSCPYNLARNRQTRMLANLSLVGCYNETVIPDRVERERILLLSAKENLRSMAFFSLTEHQAEAQHLFERTFHGIRFTKDLVQYKETQASSVNITEDQLRRLRELNHLDIKLYQYAQELFARRLAHARRSETAGGAVARKISKYDMKDMKDIERRYNAYEEIDVYDGHGDEESDERSLRTVDMKQRNARTEKSRRRKA